MDLTTEEARAELALHELSDEQIEGVLSLAAECGQVAFTSPSTGETVTIVGDDDAQAFRLV